MFADLIDRHTVSCQQRDTDYYGRIVAACTVGGQDIGASLVRQGWALAFRRYSVEYVPIENAAREARAGIWAGTFDFPWDWRKTHSSDSTTFWIGSQGL